MTSATQAGPEGQVPCNEGSSDELNDLESPGKAPGKEAEFNLLDLGNVGVVLHYFGKGFVAGGVGAIMTGVLAGYLNMHSDQIQSALNISSLPNVFAAPLGMLSDCRPLFGYHRRSYMTLGWLLVLASFAYMLQHGLPDPHYCFTDGFYQRHLPPCNPDAHNFYPALVTAFFVGSFGMATSDAAVAGRMIEFAKAEPLERRGRAQAAVQMVSLTGGFASVILAAFGFNGRMFTGSFDQRHQLSFRAYMLVFVIFCTATMLACAFCVREAVSATKTLKASNSSIRASCSSGWRLLESKCFCAVMLFTFAKGGICSIKTNAGIWVQLEWAGVRMLQNQLCGLVGTLLTMFGCWLMRNYFLNASWRKIIVVATLCVVVLGSISQLLTVFDVVRNQYFYLAEPILMDVPLAMTNLVSVFIANELADGNNCALVFGMLTTTVCVATRLSTLLGNQVFSFFTPALTDRDNYVADTELFRWTVAKSYFLTYLLILSSLLFLPLLPWQKQNAQDRKRDWSYRPCYAVMTVVFLVTSFSYTLVGDILAMTPSTNCMHFVGGPGCVPAS